MRGQPSHRIHPNALNVWRIHGAIEGGIACLAAVAAFILAFKTAMPLWIAVIVACAALLLFYFLAGPVPNWRWRRWRYEVQNDEVDLQRGVWIVKRTLIPMARVQHVDTKQGPILRKYGLATVAISTAATTHEIPALSEADAASLRDRIAELARIEEIDD